MSNVIGLVELLFVVLAGLVWGLFELRSLRRSKKSDSDSQPPV